MGRGGGGGGARGRWKNCFLGPLKCQILYLWRVYDSQAHFGWYDDEDFWVVMLLIYPLFTLVAIVDFSFLLLPLFSLGGEGAGLGGFWLNIISSGE